MGMGVARDVVGWLAILLALTGFIVCALHLGRTRWAMLLTAGFALQTLVMGFNRVAVAFISRGAMGGGFEAAFLLSSLLGVVGSAAIVGGVAGVLSELRNATEPAAAPPL